jgi:hypothetical protein
VFLALVVALALAVVVLGGVIVNGTTPYSGHPQHACETGRNGVRTGAAASVSVQEAAPEELVTPLQKAVPNVKVRV